MKAVVITLLMFPDNCPDVFVENRSKKGVLESKEAVGAAAQPVSARHEGDLHLGGNESGAKRHSVGGEGSESVGSLMVVGGRMTENRRFKRGKQKTKKNFRGLDFSYRLTVMTGIHISFYTG